MTPVGCAFLEFRMQFPRPCVVPHIHIVGIATFVDTVESSLNRIACETASSERTRAHVGPFMRAWARHLARGPSDPRMGPLIRTLTR